MNLRSRLLMIGCFVLLVQMIAMAGLYYFSIYPDIEGLEKNAVEKDLHRSLENFQRQLYILEQITQLLTWQSNISNLANSDIIPKNIAREGLLEKMVQYELNLMYILNTDKKVIWEEIIDLSNEQSYPHQGFLTSLWENYPGFLEHPSMMSLQAGIYNSSLGPMFIVSKRRELVAQLPCKSIILETDAPFLTPHPFRGKRNEPAYIPLIAEKIAALHSLSPIELGRISTGNAVALFNLNSKPGFRLEQQA